MAANNFFGYAAPPHPHSHPQAAAYAPAVAAAAPVGAATTPAAAAAVAYNQALAAASSAANSYRTAAGPATVVAYSTYQPAPPPPNSISTGATYVAPVAVTTPAVVAASQYHAASYIPFPTPQAPTAPAPVPGPYYQQPTTVAVNVSYSGNPHYQARPVYSNNAGVNVIAAPRASYTTYSHGSAASTYTYGLPATIATISVAPPVKSPPPPPLPPPPQSVYITSQGPAPIRNLQPVPMAASINTKPLGHWGQPPRAAHNLVQASPGPSRPYKARPAPKPQQLHYCEVCKISCAGPQTYQEHLEGQKHKKKEAASKTAAPGSTTRSGNALRCDLCDVTCTGSDAYAAHIRGSKHQKVVKLHTKLGKPIPSVDPVVISKGEEQTAALVSAASKTLARLPQAVQKISFVPAGQQLGAAAVKSEKPEARLTASEVVIPRLPDEKEVQPVGHDYVEEIKSDEGKTVSFNCKLCDCRFNDPNAKEMHMKGRRHRLMFKKKVNPDLVVDIKPSLRQRKIAEERAKRATFQDDFWRRREEDFRMMEEGEKAFWEERRRFEEEQWGGPRGGRFPGRGRGGPYMMPGVRFPMGPPGPMFGFPPMFRRPESMDDRHVIAKHSDIYPSEDELAAVQKIVTNIEKALKLVSDNLLEPDCAQESLQAVDGDESSGSRDLNSARILKGVMRVGILAKGLLLMGDRRVRLVMLSGCKPTATLLGQIGQLLPAQLQHVAAHEKYAVTVLEASLLIADEGHDCEFPITVEVSLTSPLMREGAADPTPPDVLDLDCCLSSLAELRHAKWFQARAAGRQYCVMVIRILRDLCQRIPTWSPIPQFALELMVEKVLGSVMLPLSPGDALRRVFEALASGLLLPDSPGLLDPCEKEPCDAAAVLTPQQRCDITASAQHALRMIAFRQIYKVLGMEQLQAPAKFGRPRFTRKRRRDDSFGAAAEEEEDDDALGEKKKGAAGGGADSGAADREAT